MDIFLIWGRITDTHNSIITLAGAWDDDSVMGNREGYQANIDQAIADYGAHNVVITRSEVDIDAVRDLFDEPAGEFSRDIVNLIWQYEADTLWVSDGWDDDTISENEIGWDEALEKYDGHRITSHRIDLDAVRRAFDPPFIPFL